MAAFGRGSRRGLGRPVVGAGALAAVLALAGCEGESGREAQGNPSSPVSSSAQVGADVFDLVLPASSPDWMATGFGSLWVRRDDGAVTRISPAGDVEATIDAELPGEAFCQGIGVSDDAVWACGRGRTVFRIDPATNEIVATLRVAKVNEQGRLTSSDGRLWLLTGDGDRLVGVSHQDNRVDTTVDLGTFCTDVSDTAPGGLLWVTCNYEGVVLRVDVRAGRVTGRVTGLPQATNVSVGSDVWVGFERGLARIDPGSLEVVDVVRVHPSLGGAVRATANGVWVRQESGTFLARIDPRTGEVTDRHRTQDRFSGGDIIEFEGQWWLTAYDDNLLARVRE